MGHVNALDGLASQELRAALWITHIPILSQSHLCLLESADFSQNCLSWMLLPSLPTDIAYEGRWRGEAGMPCWLSLFSGASQ